MVVKYDLSDIPKNATIIKAIFTYNVYYNHLKVSRDHLIYYITESWDAKTLTWNSINGFNSSIYGCAFVDKVSVIKGSSSPKFNVTTSIQNMIDGKIVNNGFVVKHVEGLRGYTIFARSNNYSVVSARPKLTIEYDTLAVSNVYKRKYSSFEKCITISNKGIKINVPLDVKEASIYSISGKCIQIFDITNDMSFIEFGHILSQGTYILNTTIGKILFTITN